MYFKVGKNEHLLFCIKNIMSVMEIMQLFHLFANSSQAGSKKQDLSIWDAGFSAPTKKIYLPYTVH